MEDADIEGSFSSLQVASSSMRLMWLPHLSDSGQHSQVVEAEAARFREVSILEVPLHHFHQFLLSVQVLRPAQIHIESDLCLDEMKGKGLLFVTFNLSHLFFFFLSHLFIWLHQALTAACGI